MTIKEFARGCGMEYQDALNVVAASDIHKPGHNIDYDFEDLRRVIIKFLVRQESNAETRMKKAQNAIRRIYDMREKK